MPPKYRSIRVLIAGLENPCTNALIGALSAHGYDRTRLVRGEELNAALRNIEPGATILGASTFMTLKQSDPEIGFPCIGLGDVASAGLAIQSFRLGAYDFLRTMSRLKTSSSRSKRRPQRSMATHRAITWPCCGPNMQQKLQTAPNPNFWPR